MGLEIVVSALVDLQPRQQSSLVPGTRLQHEWTVQSSPRDKHTCKPAVVGHAPAPLQNWSAAQLPGPLLLVVAWLIDSLLASYLLLMLLPPPHAREPQGGRKERS